MSEAIAVGVLIIGGGHSGAQLAQTLRKNGFDQSIHIISDDLCLPYDRPPLSKDFLLGHKEGSQILLREADYWEQAGISFELGCRVGHVDTAMQQATLSDGRIFSYQYCVFATGGKARQLRCAGAELDGVYALRTIGDAKAIRDAFSAASKVAIIGAGYVGLEVAAAARQMGLSVDVIEAQDRILQRVTSPKISAFIQEKHETSGINIHLNAQVVALDGEGHVRSVQLKSGDTIDADVVIIGIGIEAEADLAMAAGLSCDNGILVDEYFRTSADHVLAIGDCARHPNDFAGGLWRLESVQHAVDSAIVAAQTICGTAEKYHALPTFWSDQNGLRIQTAGLFHTADTIIERSGQSADALTLIYLKSDQIIAVDAINGPKDFMAARALILKNKRINLEMAQDPATPLKNCALETAS